MGAALVFGRWRFPIPFAVTALLFISETGCGGESWPIVHGELERARVGDPAPEYSGIALDGDTIVLGDMKGRVVLINVWGEWCPPCIRELPILDSLQLQFSRRGLTVLALHGGNSAREVKAITKIVKQRSLAMLTMVPETFPRMDAMFDVGWGIPRTVLIDRAGIVVSEWIGYHEPDAELIAAVLDGRHELSPDGQLTVPHTAAR